MRIQHNVLAQNTYRNYNGNVSKLRKNLEKLATGYRINCAGDDAAGLAISEKMRAQITGLDQAQNNARSGVNLCTTAEAALAEAQDMLDRMFALAEQSANGTYDDEVDRAQLQKEVGLLRDELDRIAESANYNGIKLLDGSMTSNGWVSNFKNVEVDNGGSRTLMPRLDAMPAREGVKGRYVLDLSGGSWECTAAAGARVSIQFAGISITFSLAQGDWFSSKRFADNFVDYVSYGGQIGATGSTVFDSSNAQFLDGKLVIGGKPVNVRANDYGVLYFDGIDDTELDPSLTFSATTTGTTAFAHSWTPQNLETVTEALKESPDLMAEAALDLRKLNIVDGTTLKIGDTAYTFALGKHSQFKDARNVVDLTDIETVNWNWDIVSSRLSQVANDNPYVQVESRGSNYVVELTEKEGGPLREEYDVFGKPYDRGLRSWRNDAPWKNALGQCVIQVGQAVRTGSAMRLQIGDTADEFNMLKLDIGSINSEVLGINRISVATQEEASVAMTAIKSAVNYVSDVRGGLGALQNRLEHTISALGISQENVQEAESCIRDTDMAKEMMAYTRNNILRESSQAMLAQANQLPQGVMQMLNG